jgi:PiT family inorganic phosphate transporter
VDVTVLLFLSSGLFLGWSLGANDAANIFGTAVGSRMVKFTTAAIVGSIFVVLGATISGGGAAHTLGKLGAVNALGGAFTAAFAAALTVYWMTKAKLPVSTSQAIVGAIVGWNLFAGARTELSTLSTIMLTWVLCPVLAAITAVVLFKITSQLLRWAKWHLLTLDTITRNALIAAGAFGAYSLGANNIANVMGVFVSSSPFIDVDIGGLTLTGVQQLFLLGAIAIAVGIVTYSKRVMMTVGRGLMPLTPVAAWVVVMSHSLVLFLFASEGLEYFLASHGLPTVPLVPVSSSQAVVGAVIGIGLLKGGAQINWTVAGRIASGWVITPIIATAVCVLSLFIVQNLFLQIVNKPIEYQVDTTVIERLRAEEFPVQRLAPLEGELFSSAADISRRLDKINNLTSEQEERVLDLSRLMILHVQTDRLSAELSSTLSPAQMEALIKLDGQDFQYQWQLEESLAELEPEWHPLEETIVNKHHNKEIQSRLELIEEAFK